MASASPWGQRPTPDLDPVVFDLIYFGGTGINRCGNAEGKDVYAYNPATDQFLSLAGDIASAAGNVVNDLAWFQGSLYVAGRFQCMKTCCTPVATAATPRARS